MLINEPFLGDLGGAARGRRYIGGLDLKSDSIRSQGQTGGGEKGSFSTAENIDDGLHTKRKSRFSIRF